MMTQIESTRAKFMDVPGNQVDLKHLFETKFVKEKGLFLDELSFKQMFQIKMFQISQDLKLIIIRFK